MTNPAAQIHLPGESSPAAANCGPGSPHVRESRGRLSDVTAAICGDPQVAVRREPTCEEIARNGRNEAKFERQVRNTTPRDIRIMRLKVGEYIDFDNATAATTAKHWFWRKGLHAMCRRDKKTGIIRVTRLR